MTVSITLTQKTGASFHLFCENFGLGKAALIRRTDIDGLEGISQRQLAEFGEAISENSRASYLYSQISRNGTHVDLDFGPIKRTSSGNVIAGAFDPTVKPGRITVFARAQSSMDDALGTFAHESRHAIDSSKGMAIGTRGSEYRAFVDEFIVRKGRVPSRVDMGELAREVNRLYAHLPTDPKITRIAGY